MGCCFAKACGGSTGRRWRYGPPLPTEEPQEEETVKEVLPETSKPAAPPLETGAQLPSCFRPRDSKTTPSNGAACNGVSATSDDASDLSESFSSSAPEKRRLGEREICDIPRQISPSRSWQKKSLSGEIRRRNPTPTAASGVVSRTMSAREPRAEASAGIRRDPGERSARRSLSPSTKRSGGGGGPHSRSASAPRASSERASPSRSGKKAATSGIGKESLDNPLVSLECFIFL